MYQKVNAIKNKCIKDFVFRGGKKEKVVKNKKEIMPIYT